MALQRGDGASRALLGLTGPTAASGRRPPLAVEVDLLRVTTARPEGGSGPTG